MIKPLALLFLIAPVFAGVSEPKKDKDLPTIKLNTGQATEIEKFIKKKDPLFETEILKVEFICNKTKKNSRLNPRYDCSLNDIN